MKQEFVMPVVVLSLLCLFVTLLLAVSNSFTKPVIEEAAAQRAEAAKREIIPHADGFELVKIEGLPRSVIEVYRTTNDAGFIFITTTLGYGGEMKLISGIDTEGKLIKTAVLSHSETQGFGTPVFEEPHAGQFWGKDKHGIDEIHVISGATISSKAFEKGIRDSFEAFEKIKGLR